MVDGGESLQQPTESQRGNEIVVLSVRRTRYRICADQASLLRILDFITANLRQLVPRYVLYPFGLSQGGPEGDDHPDRVEPWLVMMSRSLTRFQSNKTGIIDTTILPTHQYRHNLCLMTKTKRNIDNRLKHGSHG